MPYIALRPSPPYRSPAAKKEIDKQIKEIYELARMKAFDIASYYAHHLSDYNIGDRFNLADVINVTYSLARDWKNIKIASDDLLKSAV